jgi:hypothetical protein
VLAGTAAALVLMGGVGGYALTSVVTGSDAGETAVVQRPVPGGDDGGRAPGRTAPGLPGTPDTDGSTDDGSAGADT